MAKTAKKAAKVSKPKAQTATAATAPATGEKKGGNSLMIILIIVGVLCICCGGGGVGAYLFSQRAKKEADKAFQDGFSDLIEEGLEESIDNENGGDSDFSFGGELPSNFPTDVPIFAGSAIGLSSSTDDDNGQSIYVNLSTTDSVDEVVDFYQDEIENEGWDITSSTEFLGFSIVAKKGDRDLTVYIYDGEDGKTYYSITVNEE